MSSGNNVFLVCNIFFSLSPAIYATHEKGRNYVTSDRENVRYLIATVSQKCVRVCVEEEK